MVLSDSKRSAASSNKKLIVVREPNTQHVRTANITDLGNFAQRESHKRAHSAHTSISKINELIKIERGLCEENKVRQIGAIQRIESILRIVRLFACSSAAEVREPRALAHGHNTRTTR